MLYCFDISNKHPKSYISNCFICWKQGHQHVIKTMEREKSENILILGRKTGKYPDFGEKPENILIWGKKTRIYPDFLGKKQKIS